MKAYTLAATLAATCLLSSQAIYASPIAPLTPVHAFAGKSKTVSFNLKNNSKAPVQLMVGENSMTLQPGATISVKLPVGARVTTAAASSLHQLGDVIVEVQPSINGATITIS